MHPLRIAVVGSGYVGTTAIGCFTWVGHDVTGVEVDQAKLRTLRSGQAPFHEPGLDRLLEHGLSEGRLRFTDDVAGAMADCDVVFLCVGAPTGPDSRMDMRAMESAAEAIGRAFKGQVIVNKSTIPVGGTEWLAAIIEGARADQHAGGPVRIVSNPEFLREGCAVEDFLYPDRVVLGGDDTEAVDAVADVYKPILEWSFPEAVGSPRPPVLIRTTTKTAEVIKFASNAFLATKISFINEMGNICERVGADVTSVATAMGLDARIGPAFLKAGIGWGGSCLQKDLSELIATAQEANYRPRLLEATVSVNKDQRTLAAKKLQERLPVMQGRRICLLGLAFKPGTDDLRDAPSIEIAKWLVSKGAQVTAYDPAVARVAEVPELRFAMDAYEAASMADATILVTEWPELRNLDFERLLNAMKGNLFIDGRNCLDPDTMAAAGFRYEGFGRAGRLGMALGSGELAVHAVQFDLAATSSGLGNGRGNGNGNGKSNSKKS
jgi:nucleotide sugar dehydrogenase